MFFITVKGCTMVDSALKWRWKNKYNQKKGTGKGTLKAQGFTLSPGLAEHFTNGRDVTLKAAGTLADTDGPRDLAAKTKKDGSVKQYFFKSKKDAIVIYKPKKDALVYKVWKNAALPDAVVICLTGGSTAVNEDGEEGLIGTATNGE